MSTERATVATTIDPRELRRALSCFPTGVAVVTTLGANDAPVGLTVSSFNSVSMDPPLILWSLTRTSSSLAAFKARGVFAVNILAAEQEPLCRHFAGAGDRFAGIAWRPGIGGVPVLAGAVATFECRTYAIYPGGDHEIFLGEVLAYDHVDSVPLVFGKGVLGPLARVLV